MDFNARNFTTGDTRKSGDGLGKGGGAPPAGQGEAKKRRKESLFKITVGLIILPEAPGISTDLESAILLDSLLRVEERWGRGGRTTLEWKAR